MDVIFLYKKIHKLNQHKDFTRALKHWKELTVILHKIVLYSIASHVLNLLLIYIY